MAPSVRTTERAARGQLRPVRRSFSRHASLRYRPTPTSDPQFVFFPDSRHFQPDRARDANIYGSQAGLRVHRAHDLEVKVGTLSSVTTDTKTSRRSTRRDAVRSRSRARSEPATTSACMRQTAYTPTEWPSSARAFATTRTPRRSRGRRRRLSPRVRLNFYRRPSLRRTSTTAASSSPPTSRTCARSRARRRAARSHQGTLPERDDFFEGGVIRRSPVGTRREALRLPQAQRSRNRRQHGARLGDRHGRQHRRTCITGSRVARVPADRAACPDTSTRRSITRTVCGAITGGFFPTAPPSLAVVRPRPRPAPVDGRPAPRTRVNRVYLSATGIYGSGPHQRRGHHGAVGTGLFDFNKGIHVDSNFILNASAGYSFVAGNTALRRSIYVDNVSQQLSAQGGVLQRPVRRPSPERADSTQRSDLEASNDHPAVTDPYAGAMPRLLIPLADLPLPNGFADAWRGSALRAWGTWWA